MCTFVNICKTWYCVITFAGQTIDKDFTYYHKLE